MIKKSVHENDLIHGMQRNLQSNEKNQGIENLDKAVDYLHAATEILEEAGFITQADKILNILEKLANIEEKCCDEHDARGKPHKPKNPTTVSDKHTKGLTPNKMVENLKHHGIVFNLADDGKVDDLLNLDINDKTLEVEDGSHQKDFEDEE